MKAERWRRVNQHACEESQSCRDSGVFQAHLFWALCNFHTKYLIKLNITGWHMTISWVCVVLRLCVINQDLQPSALGHPYASSMWREDVNTDLSVSRVKAEADGFQTAGLWRATHSGNYDLHPFLCFIHACTYLHLLLQFLKLCKEAITSVRESAAWRTANETARCSCSVIRGWFIREWVTHAAAAAWSICWVLRL